MNPCVLGVDVGTGSARAALFTPDGTRLATHSRAIQTWRDGADFVEQSSADIWAAICECSRACLEASEVAPESVVGISFDATCSLVVLDAGGDSLPVGAHGDKARDIIVWMDHRALQETDEINAGDFEVLRYVGGKLSPEMQTPKLLWLKRHLPATYDGAGFFFDLADFLTWKASGNPSRSLCTLVCKWTFLGHENRWDEGYFRAVGLEGALLKIGSDVRVPGADVGNLTEQAARELGLTTNCRVGQGAIDAHAGGLGLLGGVLKEGGDAAGQLETALALIGGTSNCHMAVSQAAKFIPGVWGPYFGAMVPGMWLQEGGQSAAGAAIDFVLAGHPAAPALFQEAQTGGRTVYELLNAELENAHYTPFDTRDLHVVPDFLGNRSPLADPGARAIFDGLSLDGSRFDLARRYAATIEGVALGTRDILRALSEGGYKVETVLVTGGGTKNPLWLQIHADAMGKALVLPHESESVLLGAGVLAATAAGLHPDIFFAMRAMSRTANRIAPRPQYRAFYDAKFEIFRGMIAEQRARRERMAGF